MEILAFLLLEDEPALPDLGTRHDGVVIGDQLPFVTDVGFYVEVAVEPDEEDARELRVELWLSEREESSDDDPEGWELDIYETVVRPAERRTYVQVRVGLELEFHQAGEFVMTALAFLDGEAPAAAQRDVTIDTSVDVADFQ
jgi:hypothetical protein